MLRVAMLALALLCETAFAAEAPTFFLGRESTRDGDATYAAVGLPVGVGELSLGRPLSALDQSRMGGPGFAFAFSSSIASEAARDQTLGPGLLFQSTPVLGMSVQSSWHSRDGEDEDIVALTGQYQMPEIEPIGRIAIYGGAESGGTEDVYRLGTSLTRGVASAGVDVTTEESPSERRITGVYIGLDVTEDFSMGMSREVERDREGVDLPARVSVGAAISIGERQTISGAIGDVTGEEPSFGLMLGLQF